MALRRCFRTLAGTALLLTLLTTPTLLGSASGATGSITSQWLDQNIPTWQASQPYPLSFSAQFTSASYDNLAPFNLAALNANLNVLYASGASSIRIDVGYDAWLSSNQTRIGNLKDLVQNITSSGRQFVLADAAAERYRNSPEPWAQFKVDWVQRVETLAAQFKPDYYIVIKEPGWYVPMVSDANTNPQYQNATDWLVLADSLANAVHSVSPNTKVGVSIASSDMSAYPQFYTDFLRGAEARAQISFIGFDIYNIPGFTNTQSFLSENGAGGKSVWIAEAWSGTAKEVYDASRSSLDTLWIQGLYYYALSIHASVISPFFTDIFASYQPRPANSQLALAYFAGRTSVFSEYKTLEALNAQASSTTSSSTGTSTKTTSVSSSTSTTSTSPTETSSSFSTSSTSSTSETHTQANGSSDGTVTLALVAVGGIITAVVVIFLGLRRRSGIVALPQNRA